MFGCATGYIKRIKNLEIKKTWFLFAALLVLTITATMFFILQKDSVNQAAEKPEEIKTSLNRIQVLPTSISATSSLTKETAQPLPLSQSLPQAEDVVENPDSDATENFVMKWPGQGDIITVFGFGYSETFNDLRFHPGIDIALPPGYEVRAALPGTVVSISSSPMWGYEIVIKHGEKLETRYKGIKPLKQEGGYQVAKGDVIGQVIHSPKYEAKMNPHLHFEVYEYGKAVDPMKYF